MKFESKERLMKLAILVLGIIFIATWLLGAYLIFKYLIIPDKESVNSFITSGKFLHIFMLMAVTMSAGFCSVVIFHKLTDPRERMKRKINSILK